MKYMVFTYVKSFLFILMIVSFAVQKLFSMILSHLSTFALVTCIFVSCKTLLSITMSLIVSRMFSPRNSILSHLTFKNLINFYLILNLDIEIIIQIEINIIILHMDVQFSWASLVAQTVKNPPGKRETWVWSLGWEDSLEEGMATHSSILAWRILMDRGAWWAIVHGVAMSQTWLKQFSTEPIHFSHH